jgi:hypothetical protein
MTTAEHVVHTRHERQMQYSRGRTGQQSVALGSMTATQRQTRILLCISARTSGRKKMCCSTRAASNTMMSKRIARDASSRRRAEDVEHMTHSRGCPAHDAEQRMWAVEQRMHSRSCGQACPCRQCHAHSEQQWMPSTSCLACDGKQHEQQRKVLVAAAAAVSGGARSRRSRSDSSTCVLLYGVHSHASGLLVQHSASCPGATAPANELRRLWRSNLQAEQDKQ